MELVTTNEYTYRVLAWLLTVKSTADAWYVTLWRYLARLELQTDKVNAEHLMVVAKRNPNRRDSHVIGNEAWAVEALSSPRPSSLRQDRRREAASEVICFH